MTVEQEKRLIRWMELQQQINERQQRVNWTVFGLLVLFLFVLTFIVGHKL